MHWQKKKKSTELVAGGGVGRTETKRGVNNDSGDGDAQKRWEGM